MRTKEEAQKAIKALDFPLLLNMDHGGSTPAIFVAEAQDMGFKIMIFPCAASSSAYSAIKRCFHGLAEKGELAPEGQMPQKEIFGIVGLGDSSKVDAEADGFAYSDGV